MRMIGGVGVTAATIAVLGATVLAPAAVAQEVPTVAGLGADLVAAQRAHLWRVTGWGGASLLAGVGLIAATDPRAHPGWRGFGIQAAAWGAINLGIVAWAFAAGLDQPTGTLAAGLAAEDAYGNVLLVNLGLNVGYILTGGALALAAGHGLDRGQAVRGHGLGVVVQGLGLLLLDGIAYAGSRARMDALQGLAGRVQPGSGPGALDVTVLSIGL